MATERESMSSSKYDVVIVGGGTAGCVLAARLSLRAPHLQFLLLEAGPDNNDDVNVRTPLVSRRMFGQEKYDWCIRSVPQEGLDGREILQTRGKMLGGSSAINSHSLVYPNQEMHNAWASLVNDQRWAWNGMEEYYERFQRSEVGGPIKASLPRDLNRLQEAWNDAFEQLGCVAADPLKGRAMGGMTTTNAIDSRAERSHAGVYLTSAKHQANLTVRTMSTVERITLHREDEDSQLRAKGVVYTSEGQRFFVESSEVILCAGVFGSPQLLEVSGIGQRAVLERAGISPVLELAGVGENVQDHLNYGPSVEVRPGIETLDIRDWEPSVVVDHQRQYDQSRTGPLAEGGAYSFAHLPLQLLGDEAEEATLRDAVTAHKATHGTQQNQYIYDSLLSPEAATATVFMTRKARYAPKLTAADGNYMSMIAMLSHPLSHGSTHIRSASATEPPLVDPRYLHDDLDTEILARHVLQIEKLLEVPAFRAVVVPQGRRFPRDFDKPPKSIAEVKEAIRKYAATNYHPCGSCAMMTREANGVVDGSLRVYGTQNLRICDASIFPIIPRGNILTTVYAVAEKAVDIFLLDWSGTYPSGS